MQYYGTGRLHTVQNITYTSTAGTIAAPIGSQTYRLRVLVTTDAYVKVGSGTPTATTADAYLPGLIPEYFTCTPGQSVSAVQVSANGTLNVTEII